MISEYFNPIAFLLSFIVGLLYTFIKRPPKKVITIYPTPYNVGNIVYKDDANVCYKYDISEVKCPNKFKNNFILQS